VAGAWIRRPGGTRRRAVVLALLVSTSVACGPDRPDTGTGRPRPLPAPWSIDAPRWGPRGHLASAAIDECSGIVRSRRQAGVFWVHNDSGDVPRLFAVDRAGALLATVAVRGAEHVDWETLAIDDDGHLFICDVGNNRSDRRDLTIYVVREPVLGDRAPGPGASPATARTLAVPVERRLRFRYPDQQEFPDPARNHDCEAAFWSDHHLYLLSKHRTDTWTRLYRLEHLDSDVEQTVTLVDSLDLGSPVTAADLSPDRTELVVQSYEYVALFAAPVQGDHWLQGTAYRLLCEARQSEAVAHEGDVIRIVNEQAEIHLIERASLRALGDVRRPGASRSGFVAPVTGGGAARGYVPERPRTVLPTGTPVRLALRRGGTLTGGGRDARPGHGEAPVPVAAVSDADVARAALQRTATGLRLDLSWPAAPPPSGRPLCVMRLAWGALDDRPHVGPDDQVWELRCGDDGITTQGMASPATPLPPTVALERRDGRLTGSVDLPVLPAALHLDLFGPAGEEWSWGGDASMFAAFNPFLWGEVALAEH
jgi:hypothetical protein